MEIGTFIAASVAGGLGAVLRWLIDVAVSRRTRSRFPWGVWLVNVLGSFVLGLVAGWLAAAPAGLEPFATIVGAGLLGGFTTFSAFSLDALGLWQRGQHAGAAAYVAVSVGLSLAAVAAGLSVGRGIAG